MKMSMIIMTMMMIMMIFSRDTGKMLPALPDSWSGLLVVPGVMSFHGLAVLMSINP